MKQASPIDRGSRHAEGRRSGAMRWVALALGFLLAPHGCSRDVEPTLQDAFDELFTLVRLHARDPQNEYRRMALELLASETRAAIEERAQRINESLPEGAKVEPADLIVGGGTQMSTHIEKIEVIEKSENDAKLRVIVSGREIEVSMIVEDGAWKVLLPPPPPLREDAA